MENRIYVSIPLDALIVSGITSDCAVQISAVEEMCIRDRAFVEPNGEVHIGKIRKLTPRECWRLQGFTDEQFDKARATGLSDSRL